MSLKIKLSKEANAAAGAIDDIVKQATGADLSMGDFVRIAACVQIAINASRPAAPERPSTMEARLAEAESHEAHPSN